MIIVLVQFRVVEKVWMKRVLFNIASLMFSGLILLGCVTTTSENREPKTASKTQRPPLEGNIWFIDAHNHLVGRYVSRPGTHEMDYEGGLQGLHWMQ